MSDFGFPLGIAKGEYFCNRVSETKLLINNINTCVHTVLISPRRYGKTSLAYRAIEQCNYPYAKVDLYMSTNQKDIERAILKGINSLISQVSGVTQKLLESIGDYIKTIKPTLEVGTDGMKLKLEATDQSKPSDNICEALQILDQILIKKKKKVVLLIDEFQEVERVAKESGIEGAIRHVAQETEYFSIIFSGSKRHMLISMFNDRNKPLYRLCDQIQLERIHQSDYEPFINNFSKKRWGKTFTETMVKSLVEKTQCHPFYFNALLRVMFIGDDFPTVKDIDNMWDDLVEKKRADLLSETKGLTIAHKKLLVAITHGYNESLTSKNFLMRADLASATVIKGLEYLIEEDFIEKKNDTYYLVDPLLQTVLKQIQSF